MAQTYTVSGLGVTFGNNKSMLGVFNGVGSGRIVRVKRVWVLNNQTTGVTGVLTTWRVQRTTAQSGGTAQTPVKHDTLSETAPAAVLFATGGTVTLDTAGIFRQFAWSNDEPATGTGTADELECLVPLNCVWDSATGDGDIEPITLREGQGLSIQHTGTTTVGVADVFIEYTLAST